MKHVVVTPVYNEEKYLKTFIDSIINQTILPELLILVDDNSSDSSASIIKEYEAEFDWIKYVYHPSKKKKVQGSKVIEAFNFGISNANIEFEEIDIISKIDADLELPSNYFESIILALVANPKIGLVGGFVKERQNTVWVDILSKDYHVRGALKSYRKSCYFKIGGLMPVLGWDGLDEMKLFKLGWQTKNINIGVKHFRPADNDYNQISLSYKRGRYNYKNGGNLLLALIRSVVRLKNKPYVIAGIMYFLGYLRAMLKREEKNVSNELASFINKFHFKRLKF